MRHLKIQLAMVKVLNSEIYGGCKFEEGNNVAYC